MMLASLTSVWLASACGSGAESSASAQTAAESDRRSAQILEAAGLSVVRASQPGSVSQTIAEAEVRVVYNRPVARGREIFGGIVKWGETWNPGADQATRIELTRDIQLAGHPVSAGNYSLWVIPEAEEWTLILSSAWDVYHSPYPGQADDVLRFTVRPSTAPHMETLAFYFPSVDGREGVLALHWGQVRLDIPLEVPEAS
jgi:hypothetical protein